MLKVNVENKDDFYKMNAFDIFLILSIICISISIFVFTKVGLNVELSRTVESSIFIDGKLFKRLNLDINGTIPLLDGKMIVEIQNRQIRVLQSDCPQQLCVHTGWIKMPGQIIVCIPNKILIEISSVESLLDAVVQ